MTAAEIVRVFDAKRAGRDKWKARCPVHDDRSRDTLRITADNRGVALKCWAGCETLAIIQSVGLRWNDLFYDAERKLGSVAAREWKAKKLSDELYAREQRTESLKTWEASVLSKPPIRTQTKFEQDIERFCNSLEAR